MFAALYTANGFYEQFKNSSSQLNQASYPTTIQAVLDSATKSGVYKMWAPVTQQVARVYVYKEDHTNKKWVLALRYNHRGGTNPELRPISLGDFPIPTNPVLDEYKNEVDTEGWGHLTPSYLSQFQINEVAFYGSTTAHGRIINFTTSSEYPLNYITSGQGIFAGGRCYCTKPGTLFNKEESASLPQHASHFGNGKDLTHSPFYIPTQAYWSIRVDGYRWEVDNALDPDADKPKSDTEAPLTPQLNTANEKALKEKQRMMYENDTIHMVFIR